MARPVWTGNITFGLVNVPVVLYSAERRADLNLRLIDSRNDAHVRYERINDETGEEVPWNSVVKGYEYDSDRLVLLSDEELEHASPELTRTIDVEQFVAVDEIDPIYYDKPYYLIPGKGGAKGYALLRDALAQSDRVGICKVVIRTRQYVAALRPYADALLLQLLRFEQELRDVHDFDFPETEMHKVHPSRQERQMAMELINGMTESWRPEEYHDEYHDAVMKLIKDKIASGETDVAPAHQDEEEEHEEPATINFIEVLRRSVEQTGRKPPSHKAASHKAHPAHKKAARKKAKTASARKTTKRSHKPTKKKRTKKKHAS